MSDKKMVMMPKEEYDRLEAAGKDEKLRADTISSRIQEVNNALLVAEDRVEKLEIINRNPLEEVERLEARIKELESEDWCRTAIKYQERIKELESDEVLDGMKAECIGEVCVQIDDELNGPYDFIIPWAEMKEIHKMMHNSKMRLLGTGK